MAEEKNDVMLKFIRRQITNLPLIINRKKTTENEKAFKHRPEIPKLLKYVDDFLDGHSDNRFFVLTGLRGVGKTTILYQIYEYLFKEKNIPQNRMLYLKMQEYHDFVRRA